MTASTHMVHLAACQDHHGLKPIAATRRTNIITIVWIAAFVAWSMLPALIWVAQLALAALNHNSSGEPPQLPSVAPTVTQIEDDLIDVARTS